MRKGPSEEKRMKLREKRKNAKEKEKSKLRRKIEEKKAKVNSVPQIQTFKRKKPL